MSSGERRDPRVGCPARPGSSGGLIGVLTEVGD